MIANSVLDAVGEIGLWGAIAIMFTCSAMVDIARRVMRHRERMAMIEAGMHPDDPRPVKDDD